MQASHKLIVITHITRHHKQAAITQQLNVLPNGQHPYNKSTDIKHKGEKACWTLYKYRQLRGKHADSPDTPEVKHWTIQNSSQIFEATLFVDLQNIYTVT